MAKPKVAFYWCASCGGCEEAIVDLNEDILKVADLVNIVFWPCAMDFKYDDVRKMKDGEISVSFINGAIRTEENEEMAVLLRQKSKIVISFGACSHMGGIPGLGNFWDKESIFESAYGKSCPSVDNPNRIVPQERWQVSEGELTLPKFYNTVKSLDQVIDVDYYLPGCSPEPYLTMNAIVKLLSGDLPAKGTVLAPAKALCDRCSRSETKPEKLSIKKIERVATLQPDPEKCFLAQGIICMGPVTRFGCKEEGDGRCISANMPCRGCYGPPPGVKDVGAKMVSALASIVGLDGEEEMKEEDIQKLMDQIPDPAGTFYRFSLPTSMMRRKRMTSEEN
ncbi:MAG: oxidoreductase [Candidatus Cloacimonetes bacterium]|jgi:F420-non-reducing hydrogenase small subunit|nr:oxidoreductase [Candidatus Cloacimonadota bacterium]